MIELKTGREREQVKIDGVVYELVDVEELAIKDVIWLEKAGKRLKSAAAGLEGDEESVQQAEELAKLMKEFVGMLLPSAPAEVLEKLSDVQRLSIIMAFQGGASTTPFVERLAAMKGAGDGSTPSPDSAASTGDPQPTG